MEQKPQKRGGVRFILRGIVKTLGILVNVLLSVDTKRQDEKPKIKQ